MATPAQRRDDHFRRKDDVVAPMTADCSSPINTYSVRGTATAPVTADASIAAASTAARSAGRPGERREGVLVREVN